THVIYLPADSLYICLNYTATTEIYTLSLHDALPIFKKLIRVFFICHGFVPFPCFCCCACFTLCCCCRAVNHCRSFCFCLFFLREDRKSTRLNSSHVKISYAVFCLKKKIKITSTTKTD